jgi:hypothetical protein
MKYFRRGVFAALALTLTCSTLQVRSDPKVDEGIERTLTFTEDEKQTLKLVLAKDDLIKTMIAGHSAIKALNDIVASTTKGPIKLTFKWNAGLLKGWAAANKSLGTIHKIATCTDLLFPIIDGSPNADFFRDLRSVRDCDED